MLNNQSDSRIVTGSLFFLSVCAFSVVLYFTRSVIVPGVIAGFIAFSVSPAISFLKERARLSHALSVILVILAVLLLLGLLSLSILLSIKTALQSFDSYKQSFIHLVSLVSDFALSFGLELDGVNRESVMKALNDLPLFSFAQNLLKQILAGASSAVLVGILSIFLLSGESFQFPKNEFYQTIEAKIRVYLVVKFLASLLTGTLTAAILGLIGLDMALMFGVLAFVLNFIPTVGSLIATFLPLPLALLNFGFGWQTLFAILIPGAVQFAIGKLAEPKLLGDNLDLHPVMILCALMFWGLIWGVPGMLLATPFLVIMKISLQKTRFHAVSELLAGRIVF